MPEEVKKTLTPTERKIIDLRLSGISFSQLSEQDTKVAIDKILISGAGITGCKLPSTDFFADAIAKEISIFICDFGYGDFTLEEILFSMRMNTKPYFRFPGLDIEPVIFTGNCFNVSFLAKVLHNYLLLRNLLDRKLQNSIDGYK